MKVGLSNAHTLSCQFYYIYETCNYCLLQQRNSKYIDLTVEAYEENLETSRWWAVVVLQSSTMVTHYTTGEGDGQTKIRWLQI